MRKPIPILSFIRRYWLIILFAHLFMALCLNNTIFTYVGAPLYILPVSTIALMLALFLRHIFYQQTLDADAADDTFVREWRALSSEKRQILTCIYTCVFFLGVCLIAASIGK